MKILTITWSYQDYYELKDSFLYRSFIKNNDQKNFVNIHFNRNNYSQLEEEFKERYGYQYEFLLYKIFLSVDKISKLDDDYYILSDAFDVVCLDNIEKIHIPGQIMFSSEAHRYPWQCPDWNVDYSEEDKRQRHFLNSGLSVGKRDWYIDLFNSLEKHIFPLNLKTFGGDQGAITYHYLSKNTPQILLDKESKLFLSTYCKDYNEYSIKPLPIFVHDNGWNHGSPRFIEKFNLLK